MDEYTYDNIVIDPTKEGIENLIGKEVYFHDNPSLCLKNANDKSPVMSGMLVEICRVSINPFLIKKDDGIVHAHSCIIVKKEEPKPKYVPFENVEEFLDAYYRNEANNLDGVYHYLATRGIWLKDKSTEVPVYYMVTEVWDNGVVISDKKMSTTGILVFNNTTTWSELYESFTFLDDSPCGKLKENK